MASRAEVNAILMSEIGLSIDDMIDVDVSDIECPREAANLVLEENGAEFTV